MSRYKLLSVFLTASKGGLRFPALSRHRQALVSANTTPFVASSIYSTFTPSLYLVSGFSTMEILTNSLRDYSYTEIAGIGLVVVSVVYACNKALSRPRQKVGYPPGPPQDPFIGNLRQFPKHDWWSAFNKWQKEYGVSFMIPLTHVEQRLTGFFRRYRLLGYALKSLRCNKLFGCGIRAVNQASQ
jgi:hypothetical protein